jgi:hypothetical protein
LLPSESNIYHLAVFSALLFFSVKKGVMLYPSVPPTQAAAGMLPKLQDA